MQMPLRGLQVPVLVSLREVVVRLRVTHVDLLVYVWNINTCCYYSEMENTRTEKILDGV